MPKHADDDPVIFDYSASCNISFRGSGDSGFTWGDWREMNDHEKQEAIDQFLFENLGLSVAERDPED